jgi:hypothetical protein
MEYLRLSVASKEGFREIIGAIAEIGALEIVQMYPQIES